MAVPELGHPKIPDDSDEDHGSWSDGCSDGYTSIDLSIYCHESAHGRQYHSFKSGRYPLPNDDEEMAREHLRHHILLELLGGQLFLADIGDNPRKIIDLGTGSGVWAIDVAEQFPGAKVIGTDLSPVQPTWVPINARMLLDDMDEPGWPHGSGCSFVHLRHMKCVVRDMDEVLGQIYTNLQVGGWVEFQDFLPFFYCTRDTAKEDDRLSTFMELAVRGMREFGCHWYDKEPAELEDALDKAGFINIRSVTHNVPIGLWMQDNRSRGIGALMQIYAAATCEVLGAKPFAVLGLTDEERAQLVEGAKESLRDWTMHRYLKLSICYAQKGSCNDI